MSNEMVIVAVVLIVIAAHTWLYIWIKFKMDEGTILKFIKDSKGQSSVSTEEISSGVDISMRRVIVVCNKSNAIAMMGDDCNKLWQLS